MTMSPEEAVRACRLDEALQALQARVRVKPAEPKDRIFLFQLLSLLGQWDRAAAQLEVVGNLDASTLIVRQIYGQAIAAENARRKVFAGTATPLVFGEPAAWLAAFLEALRLTSQLHQQQAAELRAQALAEAPARAGTINGESFSWIADADSRMGPCLELILDGKYLWAPFEHIAALRMEPPTDLRDLVWTQTIVTWTNGGQTPALIPVRYPDTERAADDALRMSRRTEWQEQAGDNYLGAGQRMFATDAGEYPLLEVREIVFTAPSDAD